MARPSARASGASLMMRVCMVSLRVGCTSFIWGNVSCGRRLRLPRSVRRRSAPPPAAPKRGDSGWPPEHESRTRHQRKQGEGTERGQAGMQGTRTRRSRRGGGAGREVAGGEGGDESGRGKRGTAGNKGHVVGRLEG